MRKTMGKASAWKKGHINVLHLQGNLKEMAAQHGALLKDEIAHGAIPYLGQKNIHLLEQSHLFRGRPGAAKLAQTLIHLFIHKPMLAQVPRHYIEEARELCRGAGLPWEYFKEAMVQPDTLVVLLRFFLGKHLLGNMAGGFPGCTSVVATGHATGGNGVIHGRNMDYPVVGRWDTNPVVFYCDPSDEDAGHRYVGIGTAGVHTPGVTAVNEAGLSLASHFHCAKAVSVFGTPIQFIGSEIARRATTIGQAVDIASSFERAGTWSIVVSSAKENDAAVIEMVHGKLAVRSPENGRLAHTNHFRNPEFQEREILFSASVARDYLDRYYRALEMLDAEHGKVDRGTVARLLGDHFDRETGKVRSHGGNTISVITTVTSMITELSKGRFWVANAGRSPVCLGDYSGFAIDETFEGFDEREPETFSWSPQGATSIRGTKKEEAFQIFRDAYVAFHTDYDPERAADFADAAAAADPEEGHFHMAHGHFRMRLNQPHRALEAFEKAAGCVMSAHMKQVARLFRAHALDLLERRSEATALYNELRDGAIDPHIRDEARVCLRKPYRAERASNITFDLQFCDSFEYA